MKPLLAALFIISSLHNLYSQSEKQDVIYLKNGSVIRGTISGNSPAGSMKIETEGKNIWVFRNTEIDSVKKEEVVFQNKQNKIKQKGFYNITDFGIACGRTTRQNVYSPGFITINGYRFKNGISIGAGAGAEVMEILSAPLFAEFRYDLLKKNPLSPFASFQAGYSFPLQNNYGNYANHYYGGIMLNPEIGIRNYFSNGSAIVLTIGFRHQELKSERKMYWLYQENIGNTETITRFNRIVLRFGFLFS